MMDMGGEGVGGNVLISSYKIQHENENCFHVIKNTQTSRCERNLNNNGVYNNDVI